MTSVEYHIICIIASVEARWAAIFLQGAISLTIDAATWEGFYESERKKDP